MTSKQILISSAWGDVRAELADCQAAAAFVDMLPLTIAMNDHMRQEKTGTLPRPLPEEPRQREFSVGTLGLWDADHFVIYYRSGRVPAPGIIVLGRATGDVSIFDRTGPVSVTVQRIQSQA